MERLKAFLKVYLIVFFLLFLTIRFNNPDKTETRLFIEYWPLIVGFFSVGVIITWVKENVHR